MTITKLVVLNFLPGHVLIGELQVDDVEAGLGRLVGDVEGSVLVVLALDLGLARAFN